MKRNDTNGLRYYTLESLADQPLDHAFFTRLGGVSQGPYASLNLGGTVGDTPENVIANHGLLFEAFDRPFESRFDVWQVHGRTLVLTDHPRPADQKHQPADGIFTANPEVTLIMRFADCVPLIFYDPVKRIVGLVHAGWQGTVLKIGAEAVQMLQEKFGSEPADLMVGIGPSISKHHYRVGEEVHARFVKAFGAQAEAFFHQQPTGLFLDLWKANEETLRQAGVIHIEQSQICTASNLDEWYSYRQEKGVTGRFAAMVALK